MDRHRTETAENLLVNVPISRSMKTVRARSRTPVRSEERRIRRPSPQGVAESGSERHDVRLVETIEASPQWPTGTCYALAVRSRKRTQAKNMFCAGPLLDLFIDL